VDAHATGVPTRFTLNTTVLAAGPASAASGDFDDVAAMSRRVAAGIVVPEHDESDVLWWQRRASTDGRLPARDRIEAISAEGALRVELYGRCLYLGVAEHAAVGRPRSTARLSDNILCLLNALQQREIRSQVDKV
jgi:hypothetical protein